MHQCINNLATGDSASCYKICNLEICTKIFLVILVYQIRK